MLDKKISLIVPTYGRYDELRSLLISLYKQDCGTDIFEVIIVDQNDKIDLKPLIDTFSDRLNIVYYHTLKKGIANAKNKGLELSTAPIVTFPDDDCTYYVDTISSALSYLEINKDVNVVYGRLLDRETKENIMRKWPTKETDVSMFNFHYTYSAITAFIRRNRLKFDVNFGVGSSYGVGEELDYLLQTFDHNLKSVYSPTIDIWHPQLNPSVMTPEKVYYYAKGYGAVCRKHFGIIMFGTFLVSNCFQMLQIFKALLFFDKILAHKRWLALKGRIVGFFSFK